MEDRLDRVSRYHESAHAVACARLGVKIDSIMMNYREGNQIVCGVGYYASTSPYATDEKSLALVKTLIGLAGQYGTAVVMEGKPYSDKYLLRYGASEDLKMVRSLYGRRWRRLLPVVAKLMEGSESQIASLADHLIDHQVVSGEVAEQIMGYTH